MEFKGIALDNGKRVMITHSGTCRSDNVLSENEYMIIIEVNNPIIRIINY